MAGKNRYTLDEALPLYNCAKANDTALFAELFYRRSSGVDVDYRGEVRPVCTCISCCRCCLHFGVNVFSEW
jgi:hypothetical protein